MHTCMHAHTHTRECTDILKHCSNLKQLFIPVPRQRNFFKQLADFNFCLMQRERIEATKIPYILYN